jgi:hypothetical protein
MIMRSPGRALSEALVPACFLLAFVAVIVLAFVFVVVVLLAVDLLAVGFLDLVFLAVVLCAGTVASLPWRFSAYFFGSN